MHFRDKKKIKNNPVAPDAEGIDKVIVQGLYEKIRTRALSTPNVENHDNHYANLILSTRGLIAWAKTCTTLEIDMPLLKRRSNDSTRSDSTVNAVSQMTNILTHMVMSNIAGGTQAWNP